MVERGRDETSTPPRHQRELSVSSHYYPLYSSKVAKGYREFARRPLPEEVSCSRVVALRSAVVRLAYSLPRPLSPVELGTIVFAVGNGPPGGNQNDPERHAEEGNGGGGGVEPALNVSLRFMKTAY